MSHTPCLAAWATSLALVVTACGPDALQRPPPTSSQLTSELAGDPRPAADPSASAAAPASNDAPEISRSVGAQGGVLVLWPRIARSAGDADGTDLAGRVQRKLYEIAVKAVPGATVEARPDPERVCPRPKGCVAAALGAIVRQRGANGCAVVLLVSGSGPSPQRIVEWAGTLKADALTIPFREPPEPHVKVTDYASCAKIDDVLSAREADIAAAIRAAVPR